MLSPVVLSEPFLQPTISSSPSKARMSWERSFLGQSGCTKHSWCLLRPAGSGDRRRGPYASGDCPAFPPTMLSSTSWWPCGFGGQSLSEFQWASRNPPRIRVVCSLLPCHIPSSSHFWARNAGEVLTWAQVMRPVTRHVRGFCLGKWRPGIDSVVLQ